MHDNSNQNQLSQQITHAVLESTLFSNCCISCRNICLMTSAMSEMAEYSFHWCKHIFSTFFHLVLSLIFIQALLWQQITKSCCQWVYIKIFLTSSIRASCFFSLSPATFTIKHCHVIYYSWFYYKRPSPSALKNTVFSLLTCLALSTTRPETSHMHSLTTSHTFPIWS